jgi:hypothetical protein
MGARELKQPHGRVVWAGTETEGEYHGRCPRPYSNMLKTTKSIVVRPRRRCGARAESIEIDSDHFSCGNRWATRRVGCSGDCRDVPVQHRLHRLCRFGRRE